MGFELKFVKMFRVDFGSAYKFFLQWQTLLSPVTAEKIKLNKSSMK